MGGTYQNYPEPLKRWAESRGIDVDSCRVNYTQDNYVSYAVKAKAAENETPMWYRVTVNLFDWSYEVVGPKGFYDPEGPIFESGSLKLEINNGLG